MDTNLIWLAHLHAAGFSQKDLEKLSTSWYSFDMISQSMQSEKDVPTPWITPERKNKICEKIKEIDRNLLEKAIHQYNIEIIIQENPLYPARLKNLKDAPYLIYVRWNLEEKRLSLGIVWSRKNTLYGERILEHIIPAIVVSGATIVSGWAYGIDTLSHEIALKYGWYTISVFWCWVDISYPPKNQALFENILKNQGALISIFPIWTEPEPYMFPIRNEIVAALSDGIIIPEAWIKSGTLITANLALEQGRDVFAIPWDIFRETSAGTNMLIATWQAKCITQATDILEEYFPTNWNNQTSLLEEKNFDSDDERVIYNAIRTWYNTPDLLWQNTPLPIETIIPTLTLLEIGWHILLGKAGKYEIL